MKAMRESKKPSHEYTSWTLVNEHICWQHNKPYFFNSVLTGIHIEEVQRSFTSLISEGIIAYCFGPH